MHFLTFLFYFLFLVVLVKSENLSEKCQEKAELFSKADDEVLFLNNKVSTSGIFRNCTLKINSSRPRFMLRLDTSQSCLLSNKSFDTQIRVRECSDRNTSELLNESKVCEVFAKQNFVLINSFCFEISFTDVIKIEEFNRTSVFQPQKSFESIDSISITALKIDDKGIK